MISWLSNCICAKSFSVCSKTNNLGATSSLLFTGNDLSTSTVIKFTCVSNLGTHTHNMETCKRERTEARGQSSHTQQKMLIKVKKLSGNAVLPHNTPPTMAIFLQWLNSTFLRICSEAPRLDLVLYDQTASHVRAAFSNNGGQTSCHLKLSVFPPPQISVGSNTGSL